MRPFKVRGHQKLYDPLTSEAGWSPNQYITLHPAANTQHVVIHCREKNESIDQIKSKCTRSQFNTGLIQFLKFRAFCLSVSLSVCPNHLSVHHLCTRPVPQPCLTFRWGRGDRSGEGTIWAYCKKGERGGEGRRWVE
jgi:hypothetical protein